MVDDRFTDYYSADETLHLKAVEPCRTGANTDHARLNSRLEFGMVTRFARKGTTGYIDSNSGRNQRHKHKGGRMGAVI